MTSSLAPGAVIFDMDGVLVDSEPVHLDAMREVLGPLGVTYTEEDNEAFFGFTDLAVFGQLCARHRLPFAADELAARRTAMLVHLMPERCVPMAGVPAVLEWLRGAGYPVGLASGSAPPVIEATLGALGVRGFFEPVVSAVEVPRGKPAPDVFLETARRLGLEPARCLVIEDSRNGLLAARAAGMPCVIIPCPATRGQDFREATLRLDSLVELPGVLTPPAGPRRPGSRPRSAAPPSPGSPRASSPA